MRDQSAIRSQEVFPRPSSGRGQARSAKGIVGRVGVVLSVCLLVSLLAIPDSYEASEHQFKQRSWGRESVSLRGGRVQIEPMLLDRLPAPIRALRELLGEQEGGIPIRVALKSHENVGLMSSRAREELCRPEAYWLKVAKSEVGIVGSDIKGVCHGLTSLERMALRGKLNVIEGEAIDWPDHRVRALHVVLRGLSADALMRLIRRARQAHMNTLILQLADGVRLASLSAVAPEDALTVEDLLRAARFARENGLEVVPEITLLTHQHKLLKDQYPSLMFNRLTYDPRNQETYRLVLSIVDEVLELLQPKALHIGHDEVAGFNLKHLAKQLGSQERMLPPNLFLEDVMYLHRYLKARGVATWMWGDMLIAPAEFPSMRRAGLHGARLGYASLRNKIPKDIVICDWHYFDRQEEFPTTRAFRELGHEVLGATWKRPETIRNFSRYMFNLLKGEGGMIATTWFHAREEEWGLVEYIIETSGEAFWNAQ